MAQALASVHHSLPFLSDNTADSCPVTPQELARYVRAHTEGADVEPRHMAFVRTAQVEACRYWMWQVQGKPSYALVMEDGDGAWLSSYSGEEHLSPEQVLLADYQNARLDA